LDVKYTFEYLAACIGGYTMCLEDSLMSYQCGVSSLYFMSAVSNAVGSVSVGRSKIQCSSIDDKANSKKKHSPGIPTVLVAPGMAPWMIVQTVCGMAFLQPFRGRYPWVAQG